MLGRWMHSYEKHQAELEQLNTTISETTQMQKESNTRLFKYLSVVQVYKSYIQDEPIEASDDHEFETKDAEKEAKLHSLSRIHEEP